MVAKGSPDWLPAGWSVLFRQLKTGRRVQLYVDMKTGKKFSSKDEVLHYVKMLNTAHGKPVSINSPIERRPGRNPVQHVNKKVKKPEWLPRGWKMELKTRKSGGQIGLDYKCYIDPLNGYKFYSKPGVLRYLSTLKHKNHTFKKKVDISAHSMKNVSVDKKKTEVIPPRQIKEVRSTRRSNEIEKDQPSSEVKRQKLKHPATRSQLFSGEKSPGMSELKRSEIRVSKQSRRRKDSSEAGVASSHSADIVQEKHSFTSATQDCSETKKNIAPDGSTQLKVKGNKRNRHTRSLLYETDVSKKSQGKGNVENGLASTRTTDILEEKNLVQPAIEKQSFTKSQMNTGRSKSKKHFNLPRRSSKRLAGIEPDQVVKLASAELGHKVTIGKSSKAGVPLDAGLSSNSMVDEESTQHESGQGTELASHGSSGINTSLCGVSSKVNTKPGADRAACVEVMQKLESMKIENEKPESHLNLHRRSSKRLAGIEPDQVVKLVSAERGRKVSIGKSSKARVILDASLSSNSTVDEEPTQHESVKETELANQASSGTNNSMYVGSSNVIKEPCADPVAHVELKQKLESMKVENAKPEPHLSVLFGSDPCLEFAFKTLTGELPVTDTIDGWADLSTTTGKLQDKTLHESEMKNCSDKTGLVHPKKSKKKKEPTLPKRLSKRLARLEPEMVANSLAGERKLKNATIRSHKNEATQAADLANEAIVQLEPVLEKELENHFSANIETSTHSEPSIRHCDDGHKIEHANHFSTNADTFEREDSSNKHLDVGPEKGFLNLENHFSANLETSTHLQPSKRQCDDGHKVELANHFSAKADTFECEDSSNKHLDAGPEKEFLNLNIDPSMHEVPSNKHFDSGVETELLNLNIYPSMHEAPLNKKIGSGKEEIEHANHLSTNIDLSKHGESLNKSDRSPEDLVFPEKQPQVQGQIQNIDLEKPEPHVAFSLGDCWSDPCLDFAFKTLTGAIPIEDNLVQGYFQEQLDTSSSQRNGSLALPDFGSQSLFQSDISSHFDSPEKSASVQHLPSNSSLLPPGSVNLPSCSGINSQQRCLESDKDFHGKVKS